MHTRMNAGSRAPLDGTNKSLNRHTLLRQEAFSRAVGSIGMKRRMIRLAATWTWILSAAAQQTDPLLDQLQQLKQQYADTTRALEQRIAALERQIEQQKLISEKAREGT